MSNTAAEDTGPPEPRQNDFLIGHEQAEADLKAAFHSEKLPHAWLITGPRGIGKATLAYRFARYVLKQSQAGDAENEIITASAGLFGEADITQADDNEVQAGEGLYLSPDERVFKRISANGHADLMSIERQWKDEKQTARKTVIAVEDVRKIAPFMHLTPAEGGWRVVIVDAADEMNDSSANALLKVLEEPPARSLLLLVAHSPGRLLPTIRSRCRKLSINALNDANIAMLLERYAGVIPDHDKKVLIDLAQGSIARALNLASSGGLNVHDELSDILRELPRLDTVKLHKLGDKLARRENEASFRMACELLQFTLSSVIRTAATNNTNNNDPALVSKLSRLATLDRWLEVWENITHLIERSDEANLDRKQVTLNIFHALAKTVTH